MRRYLPILAVVAALGSAYVTAALASQPAVAAPSGCGGFAGPSCN
jgi:hypothetical protein